MELQEPLERKLSSETQLLLIKISVKGIEGHSGKEQVTTDRFSHIQAQLDKLRDFVDDNPPIYHAKMEILEQFKQAHNNNDLRQAIGWLAWLFRLESYRQKLMPSASEEDQIRHWEPFFRLLTDAMNRAQQAEDWDMLLLAIGLCDLLGLTEASERKLRLVYDQIGEWAVVSRYLEIKRKPRMEIEPLLVTCLQSLVEAEFHKEVNELHRVATVCGVNPNDALDDIADSFEKPNKLATSPRFSQDRLTEDWAPHMEAWIKWWGMFLEEYSLKCVKRWMAKCGDLRDTKTMEKLWLESFEPLWVAGCDIAKRGRVKDLKDGFNALFSRHSKNLSDTEQKELQDDLQAWVEWCDKWGEGALLIIAEFKEKQTRAITQSLKELRGYDEASLLGKLKSLMSE